MAKVSLQLDTRRQKKDGTYPLVLLLSHKKEAHRLSLKRSVRENHWDEKANAVKGVENDKLITAKLRSQLKRAEIYLINHQIEIERMTIKELKAKIQVVVFSSDSTPDSEIQSFVSRKINTMSLIEFSRGKLNRLSQSKKVGYAKAIRTSINTIKRFTGNDDILFVDIDLQFLKDFTAYCIGRGNKPNSISAYLRPIKTLFREAIQEDVILDDLNPFPKFQIPKAKNTKKRALRLEDIQAIRDLDLKKESAHWDARNYFLFMFNNMGINLIDVAKLKKTQLINTKYEKDKLVSGRLEYTRSKNGRKYSIKLTSESVQILNAYSVSNKGDEDFLFPIGYEESEKGFSRYDTQRKRINKRIREIGHQAGIKDSISSYYARHSWATIAKRKMVPISVIAEGLGHSDLKTTQIYLDSFDDDILDDANDRIVG